MLDDLAVRECGSGMITGRYVRSVAMRVVERARRSPSCSAMRNGRVRRDAWGGGAVSLLAGRHSRSEEHTSELQSLMRISYAVFCLKKKSIRVLKLGTEKMPRPQSSPCTVTCIKNTQRSHK